MGKLVFVLGFTGIWLLVNAVLYSLFKSIDEDIESHNIFNEPIKIKGNDNDVEWNEYGEGTGWIDQAEDIGTWGLASPVYDSSEEAVKAWNAMVRRMNGDE